MRQWHMSTSIVHIFPFQGSASWKILPCCLTIHHRQTLRRRPHAVFSRHTVCSRYSTQTCTSPCSCWSRILRSWIGRSWAWGHTARSSVHWFSRLIFVWVQCSLEDTSEEWGNGYSKKERDEDILQLIGGRCWWRLLAWSGSWSGFWDQRRRGRLMRSPW